MYLFGAYLNSKRKKMKDYQTFINGKFCMNKCDEYCTSKEIYDIGDKVKFFSHINGVPYIYKGVISNYFVDDWMDAKTWSYTIKVGLITFKNVTAKDIIGEIIKEREKMINDNLMILNCNNTSGINISETSSSWESLENVYKKTITTIKKVIFNDPATIVYWKDGTKTVVKVCEGETFSKWSGLALCYCKKMLCDNDTVKFHKLFKEWCE